MNTELALDELTTRQQQLQDAFRRHNHDGIETKQLNNDLDRLTASFETGEQVNLNVYVPFAIRITRIRGRTIKAIAATDNGTITFKNAAGATIATFTATASTTIDTDLTAQLPTANNLIAADSFYEMETAKSTAGGKVLMTIEYIRI